jgi:hypothetical protein
MYEEVEENENHPEEGVNFRQHEKITSKPINLIQYFMNLIWEENP